MSEKRAPYTPSPKEIERAKPSMGGWNRETLGRWGVAWPPKKGWRKRLEKKWERLQ